APTLLVHAGSGGPMRLDAGERVVAPFLWNRGVLRLAGLAVTHDDTDHAGGMAALRGLFRVGGEGAGAGGPGGGAAAMRRLSRGAEQWRAASAPSEPRRFGRAIVPPRPPAAASAGRRN